MKHISSKLILMTVSIVTTMMIVTGLLSLFILKNETRAYTFQNQLLQAQNISREIEIEISKLSSIAAELIRFRGTSSEVKQEVARLTEGTRKINREVISISVKFKDSNISDQWVESSEGTVSAILPKTLRVNGTYIYSNPAVTSDSVILFMIKNALVAIRVKLDKIKAQCDGSSVGVFNRSGEPIFYCDPKIISRFNESPEALKRALSANFSSGSFEKDEGGISGLWAYSDLAAIGKVVSFISTSDAYRPAYVMTLKIMLLVFMAIGIGIMASIWVSRMVVRPIVILTEATQRIENGDFDTPIEVKTNDETSVLARAIYSMAQKIKVLIKSEVEKVKLEGQLELAGEVQRTLIPKSELEIGNFKLSSFYKPADECGGDWWGYIQCEGKLAVLIGDVTGHGYPSALLVATTKGYLSMLQTSVENLGDFNLSPSQMLQVLNRVVHDVANSGLNMTALCVLIDQQTGEFQMATAGHNPMYHLSDSNQVHTVESEGVRLGEYPTIDALLETSGQLKPGEKLILYTDGIQDIGPADRPLGRKGFKKFLQKNAVFGSSQIIRAVGKDLLKMHENKPLIDDITMVVVENRASQDA